MSCQLPIWLGNKGFPFFFLLSTKHVKQSMWNDMKKRLQPIFEVWKFQSIESIEFPKPWHLFKKIEKKRKIYCSVHRCAFTSLHCNHRPHSKPNAKVKCIGAVRWYLINSIFYHITNAWHSLSLQFGGECWHSESISKSTIYRRFYVTQLQIVFYLTDDMSVSIVLSTFHLVLIILSIDFHWLLNLFSNKNGFLITIWI